MDLHSLYESAREPDRFDAIEQPSNVIDLRRYFRRRQMLARDRPPPLPLDWTNPPPTAA